MVQIADVYRLLVEEETVLPLDQFNLATLSNDCWGPVDKFAGHRVREVHEKGKIIFRRLVNHEVQGV